METVLIKHKISKRRYYAMRDDEIASIVRLYSGRLDKIEDDGNCIILYIVAPSTWSCCLLNSILLPYRFI